MTDVDVTAYSSTEEGSVNLEWQAQNKTWYLGLSSQEVRGINDVAFADYLENAAKQMHEWSQKDEQVDRPWGEDGCSLCRTRVKMTIDLLHGKGLDREGP